MTVTAVITQPGSCVQKTLLQIRLRAIPSATWFTINKQAPIQPLIGAAANPSRNRIHTEFKLPGHRTQSPPGSYLPNHLTSLLFNGAFFAMTTSPKKPSPYRSCPANAEPQVSRER